MDEPMTALPEALVFPMGLFPENEPLRLYDGEFEVTQNGATASVQGHFQLEWFPFPRFAFHVHHELAGHTLSLGTPVTLRLPDGTSIQNASINSVQAMWPTSGTKQFSGLLSAQVIRPCPSDVAYVVFAIVNLSPGWGTGIRFADGGACAARREFRASGWKITVDQVQDASERHKFLKSNSGFAITHVGRVEREDSAPFTAESTFKMLPALSRFFSFCEGRWCSVALPHGYSADGTLQWVTWRCDRVEPYKFRLSWTDDVALHQLEGAFPGFIARWEDDDWHDVISNAIHWYVEANAGAGATEGAIVLTQTAFELLASAVLVENHLWLSSDGFEKLPAADRIRLLFVWAGIPIEVPSALTDLLAVAKAETIDNSPSAMTAIRNTITHPTKKNRERYKRHTTGARREAWTLGLWYLELCLLKLFDYSGKYSNRMTQKWSGQVEDVPWKF